MTQTTKQVIEAQQRQAEQERKREQQAKTDWGLLEEPEGPEDPEDAFDLKRFACKGGALAPAAGTDWWTDEATAGTRLIRGNRLKYADRQFTYGRDNRPMRAGVQLIALSGATAWQRWADKKVASIPF
jgi:hypothetical protein